MRENIREKSSLEIARDNYSEYSAFILKGRALPSILDGMKNVERRLVWVMLNYPEEKVEKSSAIEGDTLKLHPHGAAYYSLVKLAQLGDNFLVEAHGNFGSRDLKPSAHRYTSARLTKISRMIWKYYKYSDMIDGELDGYKEPEAIPSLLPLSLIAGTEGMGSGLATVYPEFDPISLIDSMLEILRDGKMTNYPKLSYSEHLINLVDRDLLEKGKGKITFQSKVYGSKELIIKARPPRLTWENLESIAEKLKLSINNLGDEIVFSPKNSLSANKLEALKIKLEESLKKKIAYDMLAYKDNQALLVSVKDILTQSLELLVTAVEKYKEAEIRKLEKELRVLKAQEFLSQRLDKVVSMNIDKLIDSEKAELERLKIDTADIKLAGSRSLSSFTKIREKISAKEDELSETQNWILREILMNDYEELREELLKYDKNAKREPS